MNYTLFFALHAHSYSSTHISQTPKYIFNHKMILFQTSGKFSDSPITAHKTTYILTPGHFSFIYALLKMYPFERFPPISLPSSFLYWIIAHHIQFWLVYQTQPINDINLTFFLPLLAIHNEFSILSMCMLSAKKDVPVQLQ
jgi:hypothetical protein